MLSRCLPLLPLLVGATAQGAEIYIDAAAFAEATQDLAPASIEGFEGLYDGQPLAGALPQHGIELVCSTGCAALSAVDGASPRGVRAATLAPSGFGARLTLEFQIPQAAFGAWFVDVDAYLTLTAYDGEVVLASLPLGAQAPNVDGGVFRGARWQGLATRVVLSNTVGDTFAVDDLVYEAPDADGDGYSAPQGDCDDADPTVGPEAVETPYDGVDQDCSGADLFDADGDGQTPLRYGGSDCDDTNAAVYSGAPEVLDGVDNNCDGRVDERTQAFDDDGDGASELEGDCDDADPAVGPGANEVPYDGVDQDCSGADLTDVDGDGYDGGPEGEDCNDLIASISPGALEICGDHADEDCDGVAAQCPTPTPASPTPSEQTDTPGVQTEATPAATASQAPPTSSATAAQGSIPPTLAETASEATGTQAATPTADHGGGQPAPGGGRCGCDGGAAGLLFGLWGLIRRRRSGG